MGVRRVRRDEMWGTREFPSEQGSEQEGKIGGEVGLTARTGPRQGDPGWERIASSITCALMGKAPQPLAPLCLGACP